MPRTGTRWKVCCEPGETESVWAEANVVNLLFLELNSAFGGHFTLLYSSSLRPLSDTNVAFAKDHGHMDTFALTEHTSLARIHSPNLKRITQSLISYCYT